MEVKTYICEKPTIVELLYAGVQNFHNATVIHKGAEVGVVFIRGAAFGRLFYAMSGGAGDISGMNPEIAENIPPELHLHMHPDEPLLSNFKLKPTV